MSINLKRTAIYAVGICAVCVVGTWAVWTAAIALTCLIIGIVISICYTSAVGAIRACGLWIMLFFMGMFPAKEARDEPA